MKKDITLAIIKPNAMKKNVTGDIISMFEKSGLNIIALKSIKLSLEQVQSFYEVHKERPFYNDLCKFMISSPVIALVLKGDNPVQRCRDIMGATDPQKAADGTIRKKYGDNIQENAVHGSDSPENALKEINFFFSESELIPLLR